MLKGITILTLAISLIACGGSADKKTKSTREKSTETKTAAEPKAEKQEQEVKKEKEIVEIELIAQGEDMTAISYEPKSLTIPAGSKVKLTLKNESQAAGMYHNFVLVTLGKGQDIASMGIKAGKDNEFVPKDENVIAYTKVVEMGGSTTIEFDAPPKGSYHYICTYPGHYPNMIGRLNVE